MYRFLPIAIVAQIGCATPAEMLDTGDVRSRDNVPHFSDANEIAKDTVCYPGDVTTDPLCLPLHPAQDDQQEYHYPQANDPRYQAPTAYIDLRAIEGDMLISEHMQVGELAEPHKGQWAVIQPHLIESLQAIRDTIGPVVVGSGYRSPAYNRHVGGAQHSRHMYGDAVDIYGLDVPLRAVRDACEEQGASYIEVYNTHVHCDWRDETLDEGFFGHHHDHDWRGKSSHVAPESENEFDSWAIETFAW